MSKGMAIIFIALSLRPMLPLGTAWPAGAWWLDSLDRRGGDLQQALLDFPAAPELNSPLPELEQELCALAPELPLFVDSTVIRLARWYAGPGWSTWCRLRRQARPVLDLAMEEVQVRQLPSAIALLPLALGGGQGAAGTPYGQAGPWRLDLATALRAGLRVDALVDERRAHQPATRAALDRLQELLILHQGNWGHCLVAFACGPANLKRALDRCGSHASLGQLAAAVDPADRELLPLFMAFLLLEHRTPGARHWDALAPVAQSNPAPLSRLQTGVVEVTPALASPEAASEQKPQPERRITVRSGDTLEALARRHGIGVKALKRANGLKGDLIRPGMRLRLPGSKGGQGSGRARDLQPSPLNERSSKSTFRWYTIRPGDTLYDIAAAHPGVSVDAIMELNHIKALIQPGQRIRIPLP